MLETEQTTTAAELVNSILVFAAVLSVVAAVTCALCVRELIIPSPLVMVVSSTVAVVLWATTSRTHYRSVPAAITSIIVTVGFTIVTVGFTLALPPNFALNPVPEFAVLGALVLVVISVPMSIFLSLAWSFLHAFVLDSSRSGVASACMMQVGIIGISLTLWMGLTMFMTWPRVSDEIIRLAGIGSFSAWVGGTVYCVVVARHADRPADDEIALS